MIANLRMKWLLLGALGSLGACAGLNNGADPIFRLQDGSITAGDPATETAVSEIRQAIASDCLDVDAPSADAATRRNRLVSAYMFAVDLVYQSYERNLLNSVREDNLGAAVTSLALSSIGSVIGNQDVARALSTTNSIVTGTHTAIGRDYLLNQTLTVLQTQMRANRATQRALIIRRRSLDYGAWDSCMALSDVLAFEQAGTLNGAIAAVAADAADAQRAGEQQARDAVQRVTQARDPLSVALQAYLAPNDEATRRDRRAAARTIVEEEGLLPTPPMDTRERLSRILNDGGWDRERSTLARRLIGRDAAGTTALAAALPQ